eukprot:12914741-Prorocentrum_lima.AAC.1
MGITRSKELGDKDKYQQVTLLTLCFLQDSRVQLSSRPRETHCPASWQASIKAQEGTQAFIHQRTW